MSVKRARHQIDEWQRTKANIKESNQIKGPNRMLNQMSKDKSNVKGPNRIILNVNKNNLFGNNHKSHMYFFHLNCILNSFININCKCPNGYWPEINFVLYSKTAILCNKLFEINCVFWIITKERTSQ